MQEQKNKLFVSNLAYEIDDNALSEIFAAVEGVQVTDAKVIVDKFNDGRSKGFGFVTLDTEEMAEKCISELNGKEISGRQVFVNVARPQEKRDDRSGDRRPNNFNRSYR